MRSRIGRRRITRRGDGEEHRMSLIRELQRSRRRITHSKRIRRGSGERQTDEHEVQY